MESVNLYMLLGVTHPALNYGVAGTATSPLAPYIV